MDNGSSNGMVMPVAPIGNAYGYGAGNGYPFMPMFFGQGTGGNGGMGGWDSGWWVILFLFALMGNGFGGWGGMGGNNFAADGAMLYPWMNQAEVTTNGFQNLSTQNQITAVQSDLGDIQTQLCGGFADVQQSLCNGFAGVNATVNNGFANAEASNNARQIANMQQAFNSQTAITAGLNALGTQFADCCCENRLANCQTQNIIQNEGNQTRFADANNTRDIIQSQTTGTQAILDKLCQLELDAKNDKISDLERQLTFANLQASQTAQTARLERSNSDVIDGLYNRLATCPVGTMPVYGNQPIFTCPQNQNSCGCGCGNF